MIVESKTRGAADTKFLLTLIDEAFDRKSWHGPNLKGTLRGLSAAQAVWRPQPGRHNIWELVLHTAYWKYAVRRRITKSKRGSFPLSGSNWFPSPAEQNAAAWKRDVALLVAQHRELRRVIAELSVSSLRDSKRREATLVMIRGIAAHDLYHAGQIQLLKRLCPLH